MSRARQPSRRTVLSVAVAAAVAGGTAPAAAAVQRPASEADDPGRTPTRPIDYHSWTTYREWRLGAAQGVRAVSGARPGVVIGAPAGRTDYTDPHTGTTATWE